MELKQLYYFVKLAEREHISMTADQLQISQSALSKSLRSMEEELGVRLFDRKGKRIVVNAYGQIYLNYARQALDSVRQGENAMRKVKYEVTGEIRIKTVTSIGFLNEQIYSYQELNPHVRFHIEQYAYSSGKIDPNESADYIITANSEGILDYYRAQFWNVLLLREERLGILVSEDSLWYPGDYPEQVDLADFALAPFVTLSRKQFDGEDLMVGSCRKAGFVPRISCEADDFSFRLGMVARGLAVTIISEGGMDFAKTFSEKLHFYRFAKEEKFNVYLMHPRESLMSEAARDFLEFLDLEGKGMCMEEGTDVPDGR
ncbi:MAG: LysR family transcriptional regulator [Lachnospiraceae bacterium]|nr:LysR family transcriptional regulator [Lachnospiraceae bacterium]